NYLRRAANLHDTVLHAARAVAQLCSDLAGNFGDLLYDMGQLRVLYSLVFRNAHDSLVDLLDDVRPHRQAPFAHGLDVGHPGTPDAGELAVDEIGAHFSLQYGVSPVARMLANEQPHHTTSAG